MQLNTLSHLECPHCASDLRCDRKEAEIRLGSVQCVKCKRCYPILAGVLILVKDVESYLIEHVKGISRYVSDKDIPKEFRSSFEEAKNELDAEHIEQDLEAERVNALYVMNHYLRAKDLHSSDPLLDELIQKHWNFGPLFKIKEWFKNHKTKAPKRLIELGCGVGGLYAALHGELESYLGLDSSFASVALARHFALGEVLFQNPFRVPEDLLHGGVSRSVNISPLKTKKSSADFIVCDLNEPAVKKERWNFSAALNVIDMLPKPNDLPQLQLKLLSKNGIAIQSCPYIWHPHVAERLKKSLPKTIASSSDAVEHLYKKSGFSIEHRELHIPWLFFKHNRQLEIYSVHLFCAAKTT